MKRRRIALLAVLCAGVAALAGVWLAQPTAVPLVLGAQQAPASASPAGAERTAPGERAIPAAGGLLEVLVMHSGVPRGGAEVRLFVRHGLEPGAGTPGWRLAGSATTRADGVAAVPASPGTYLVAARAAGLAPRQVVAVRRADEALTRVMVSLVQGVAVTGRVLARESGEPVPFAALSLLPPDDGSLGSQPIPAEERATAVTDPSGGFGFAVAPGPYLLEASATGYTRARVTVTAPQAGVEVRLAPGAVVEGFVRGPDGAPAAGAEVLLAGGEELVRGTTGSSGGFALEVTPGSYSVTARSDRSAGAWPVPVTVAAGGRAQGIEIWLGAAGAVAGVVAGVGGAPIQGASVALTPHDGGGEVARAETDASGRFAVETLAAGSYDAGVTADGWSAKVRSGLALLPGERVELAFALVRSGGVQGTVVDGAGRPLAGVRVRDGRRTVDAPGSAGAETRTDEAGRYRLAGLDAGPCEVTATRGDATSRVSVFVAVPPGAFATADFTLGETGRLEGLVTRREGGPVGRAVVEVLTRGSPTVVASAKVEADGRYGVQLAPGEYRAWAVPAEAEGAAPVSPKATAAVQIVPGQVNRVDLVLMGPAEDSSPPALVQVRVVEPGGSAAAGSLVLVTTADDLRSAGSAVTDEDGFARLDLAERAGLLARAFLGGRVGGPVPLAPSGPTVVQLRAASRLRGRVVAPDGPPPAGFTLELVALGDDVSTVSTVGGAAGVKAAQGVQAPRRLEFNGDRFDVADVRAGPTRLLAQTTSGRLARAELELAPGELREVELVLEPGATVEGRVVDARSQSPVQGASVFVLAEERAPPRSEATTDAAGRFRLTGLQAGVRRLRLVAPGYAPVERDAELDYLGNVDLGDIALASAPDRKATR